MIATATRTGITFAANPRSNLPIGLAGAFERDRAAGRSGTRMLLAFMRWGGRAAGVRSLCDWRGAFDGRPGGFDGRCGAFDGRRPWLGVFGSGRGGGSAPRPGPGALT